MFFSPQRFIWLFQPEHVETGTLQVRTSYFHIWFRGYEIQPIWVMIGRSFPLLLICVFMALDWGRNREEEYKELEDADDFIWFLKPFNFTLLLVVISYWALFRLFTVFPKKKTPYVMIQAYLPEDYEPLYLEDDWIFWLLCFVSVSFSVLPPLAFTIVIMYGATDHFGVVLEWQFLTAYILTVVFYFVDVLCLGNYFIAVRHFGFSLIYLASMFLWLIFLGANGIVIYPAFDFVNHFTSSFLNMIRFVFVYYLWFAVFLGAAQLKQTVLLQKARGVLWFRERPEEKVRELDPFGF